MKNIFRWLPIVYCCTLAATVQAQEYVITDFGVGADSTVINTKAIQQVIDKAEANGGGTIIIPKGTFLSGALFFKPKTKLKLQEGAMLKGSDDIADYPLIPSRMEGLSLYYYAALINAYYVDSFSITGPGTIDGNGQRFWKNFWANVDSMTKIHKPWTNLEVHRPRLVFIWGCNNVNIQQVKLHNSGFWTTHLYKCNNVTVQDCDIRAPWEPVPAPSSDGIDLDGCKQVLIKNCYISVNDDGIAVKGGRGLTAHLLPQNGPVEDVLIDNCTFGKVHASLTFGSDVIRAKNVTMQNCKVDNNNPIVRFKMRGDTYQSVENVTITNITGTCGTIVSLDPWTQFVDLKGVKDIPFGVVKNVTISNINVKCNSVGTIQGNPLDKISDFYLKNITAEAKNPELKNIYPGVTLENVMVNGKALTK